MTQLLLSSIDFENSKTEFINYLKTKEAFSDIDFTGSNINVWIDSLVYHSNFLGVLANATYNETMLDTVSQRKNALSIAYNLSYDVERINPSVASVTVKLVDKNLVLSKLPLFDFLINTLVLPRFTLFNSVDGFSFITLQDYILSPDNNYTLTFDIREGSVITDQLLGVGNGSKDQNFRLNEKNIANTFLELYVDDELWTNQQDITLYNSDSKYYQVKENFLETYDFKFGNGDLGIIPPLNANLYLTYMTSVGSLGNNKKGFKITDNVYADGIYDLAHEISNAAFSVTTESKSTGGSDKESIDFIRKAAPISYQAQGRAITQSDYGIILRKHPFVEYLSVYGGESLSPPSYGFVYATIKPPGADFLTTEQEEAILAYINDFNIASIRLKINPPTYINIVLNVSSTYNSRFSSQTTILSAIKTAVLNYFSEQSVKGTGFYYSGALNKVSMFAGVLNANMTLSTYSNLAPKPDGVYFINFGQEITPGSISLVFDSTKGFFDDSFGKVLDKENNNVIGSINYQKGILNFSYSKLLSIQKMNFSLASGNVELFQNVLLKYTESESTFKATGVFN